MHSEVPHLQVWSSRLLPKLLEKMPLDTVQR